MRACVWARGRWEAGRTCAPSRLCARAVECDNRDKGTNDPFREWQLLVLPDALGNLSQLRILSAQHNRLLRCTPAWANPIPTYAAFSPLAALAWADRFSLAWPHLHRDWGSPHPHLHRDWAHPTHICAGTGLAPPTSAPGLGLAPAPSAPGPAVCRLPPSLAHMGKLQSLNVRNCQLRLPPQAVCDTGLVSTRVPIGLRG